MSWILSIINSKKVGVLQAINAFDPLAYLTDCLDYAAHHSEEFVLFVLSCGIWHLDAEATLALQIN
jgi:hypothetical protein